MMDYFPGGESKEVEPTQISPLANTYLPGRLSEATSSRATGINAPRVMQVRDRDWDVNSALDVYSASRSRWYVAYVLEVNPGEYESQMLTVRFWDESNEAKQKNSPRNDASLAHLGTHTQGQLPPGFKAQPSVSRPGTSAFLDTATGMKYSSPEVAWNVHFQRLREGPQMQAPAQPAAADAQELPMPRRSPAAIAAGLAVDVSPAPRLTRPSSKLCESVSTAVSSSPSSAAEDRWKQMKSQFEGQLVADLQAQKMKPVQTDAQAKRSVNQPQRACPTFSPSHLDMAPPPISPATGPSAGQMRKSAPAFAAAMGT